MGIPIGHQRERFGRNVKLADLADNCDLSRIAEPSEADYQRIEKYQRAIKLIHAI